MVLAMAGLKAVLVLSGCIMMCESKECTPQEQAVEVGFYNGLNSAIDNYKKTFTQEDFINYGICVDQQRNVCNGSPCESLEGTILFLSAALPAGCDICRSFAGEFVIRTQAIDNMNAIDCDGLNYAETIENGSPPPRPWYNAYVDPALPRATTYPGAPAEGVCFRNIIVPPVPDDATCSDSCGQLPGGPLSTCPEVEAQMYEGGCLSTCSAETVLIIVNNQPELVQLQCNFTAESIALILGKPNPNPDDGSGNDDDDSGGVSTSKKAIIGGIVGGAAAFVLIGGAIFWVLRNRAGDYGAKKPGKSIGDDRL